MDRSAPFDVMELKNDNIEALVGQIPLKRLDFLIQPSTNSVIPDPSHGDQIILDLF